MTRFENPTPFQEIQLLQRHLVEQFGLRKIIFALVIELVRPRASKPQSVDYLNDHLRRDVGLPPKMKATDQIWPTLK